MSVGLDVAAKAETAVIADELCDWAVTTPLLLPRRDDLPPPPFRRGGLPCGGRSEPAERGGTPYAVPFHALPDGGCGTRAL